MQLSDADKTILEQRASLIHDTERFLKARDHRMKSADNLNQVLDSLDQDDLIPAPLKEILDAVGDHGVMIMEGINRGIQAYQMRNGGEQPAAQLVAAGIAAGYQAMTHKDQSGKSLLDSLSNDHHEALSVVPAVVMVTIATRIATSLPIVAQLPNPTGSNEVPFIEAIYVADRPFLAVKKGERLDGDNAGKPYFENRPEYTMANTTGNTYSVVSHSSYSDYSTLTVDTTSPLAPFLGGRVSVCVNGIEVAHDRFKSHKTTSGSHSLQKVEGVKIGGTAVELSSGTVNLDTHTVTATFSAALPAGSKVTAKLIFDFERKDANGAPLLQPPGIDAESDAYSVLAAPMRAKITVTIDAKTQMANELGLDIQAAALSIVQNKFYFEQTVRLLSDAKRLAENNDRVVQFDYNLGQAGGATDQKTSSQIMQELRLQLDVARTRINARTLGATGSAGFDLFVGDNGAAFFGLLPADFYTPTDVSIGVGDQIARVGQLRGGINVYHVPNMAGLLRESAGTTQALLVPRSTRPMTAAFVGHTAVPPMVITGNGIDQFDQAVGIYSRTAAELNPISRYADQCAVINFINMPVV